MFEKVLNIFQHSLKKENRVGNKINNQLLKLVDKDLIEDTSQKIVEALSSGERVWMTSDLHLFHTNIIGFCDRPFFNVDHMTEALVAAMRKIPANEIVIYVGDMAMVDYQKAVEIVRSLPGRKILVAGNHDFFIGKNSDFSMATEPGLFEAVVPFLTWQWHQNRQVIVSHYPMLLPENYKAAPILNYHGHLHEKTLPPELMIKYMNVGWDVNYSINCL